MRGDDRNKVLVWQIAVKCSLVVRLSIWRITDAVLLIENNIATDQTTAYCQTVG